LGLLRRILRECIAQARGESTGHCKLTSRKGGRDRAAQFSGFQCAFGQQHPKIKIVLHAGVGHAQQAHRMKFLSHHGVLRVGAQSRSGQIFEQHRVVHRFRRWRDRIAETDVHLQCNASTVQLRLQVYAYAAVARFLAYHRGLDGGWIKRDAILGRDLADLTKRRNCGVEVVRPKSE
jgi:hypothetical protein